jgi:transposase-like protein
VIEIIMKEHRRLGFCLKLTKQIFEPAEARVRLVASPFDDDTAAREALEAMRWPDGPRCPRCVSGSTTVFRIGGIKQSHREGLYHCKQCRRQFSVTVGTALERLRVPLRTWVRSAYAFSYERAVLTPLKDLQADIGVSYRTVLRMRDMIKRAARKYRGYRRDLGAWPRSFMRQRGTPRNRAATQRLLAEGKHPSQHAIRSTGVLSGFHPERNTTAARLRRTECLLRLLLATSKPAAR